jgi:hypothetical protein
MTTKNKVEINTTIDDLRCDHCNRSFVKPSTLANHMCEQKRRWTEKDRPANRIGYSAWLKFYKQFQPTSKKNKEYRDFSKSAYYTAFVKYGTYCADVSVVNPHNYVDWLLKEKVSIDNWASDKHYGRYLIEYLKIEDSMDAVKRSVETLLKIAEKENLNVGDVLRYSNANKICHLVMGGHLSPWLLFNSESGQYFLSSVNQNQTEMIFEYINPDLWNIKFMRDKETLKEVQMILKAAGI